MKSLYRLLPLLRHDRFQSGQELAGTLGVTRPTVANWVAELVELGVDVHAVKGRGYRLAEPLSLLDRERVLAGLNPKLVSALAVFDIRPDIDSTNRWVLESKPAPGQWSICAADYQHSGRGRRGRPWQSPPGSSVMVSVAVRETFSGQALYAASLIVGVAVVRAVAEATGARLELKWPNDLYYRGAKLGGILCELQGNPLDQPLLVIGLGLNVSRKPAGLDQDATCLTEMLGHHPDRNDLLIAILNQLHAVLGELAAPDGLARLLAEWGEYDCIRDRDIRLIRSDRSEAVTARGVDAAGQLVVEAADGRRYSVNGGEVSVRW